MPFPIVPAVTCSVDSKSSLPYGLWTVFVQLVFFIHYLFRI